MTTATAKRRNWTRGYSVPEKVCARCGAAFYTTTGLSVHAEQGCGRAVSRAWSRRIKPHPNLVVTGRRVTDLLNASRYRCGGCDLTATPGPLTLHQRATGHEGREPVE